MPLNRSFRPSTRLHKAPGFSLVELLVLIAIVVILFTILVPYVRRLRERDHRARCAENLRELMSALHAYAEHNKSGFPRVVYDAAHKPNGYVAYSGGTAASAFTKDTTVRPNDVTASLWLLVRAGLVKPSVFICPSTFDVTESTDKSAWMHRSNFTSGRTLSYSYASPFSSAPGYKLDDFLPADFALMADKNPGVSASSNPALPAWDASPFQLAGANSNNHDRAGQNVLYTDGHVAFQPTPYCGVGRDGMRDNIYTALARSTVPRGKNPPGYANGFVSRDLGPTWDRDSYLVPTEQD